MVIGRMSFRCAAPNASGHTMNLSVLLLTMMLAFQCVECKVVKFIADADFNVLFGKTIVCHLTQEGTAPADLKVKLVNNRPKVIKMFPEEFEIASGAKSGVYQFKVTGLTPGYADIYFHVTPSENINDKEAFFRIGVMKSSYLNAVSIVVGWIYFVAWTVSFYPQMNLNYRRKSVVGLSLDFVSYEIMGFTTLFVYNCGFYSSAYIQSQYFDRFPRGHVSVNLTDMFYSIHAVFMSLFIGGQVYVYERAHQRVSTISRCILTLLVAAFVSTCCLAIYRVIMWLDFIFTCSYIKLFTTCIKYVPQALLNYQRKSTEGWSIGATICDLTGATLSIAQMILIAYNFKDWWIFYRDITQLGVALFTMFYDVLFLTQHYIIYRQRKI